jgi:uncharacterized protein (TIGR02001 family)
MRRRPSTEALFSISGAAMSVVLTSPALALDSAESRPPIVMNIGVVSQYALRGLTQTDQRPAIQGGADYSLANGLYFGTWFSNVSWFSDMNLGDTNPVEWDLYMGFKCKIVRDFGCDIGILRYMFPGRYPVLSAGTVRPDTTEPYVGLSWRWLSLKFAWTASNSFGVDRSVGSSYTDITVSIPLRPGLSAELHAGHQHLRNVNEASERLHTTNSALYSYTDTRTAVTYAFATGWTVSLAHTTSDARDVGYLVHGRNIGAPQTILGLAHVF